jgi:hypothetical protein
MSVTTRRGFNPIHGHEEGDSCNGWCRYEPKLRVRAWRALLAGLSRTDDSHEEDWPLLVASASKEL